MTRFSHPELDPDSHDVPEHLPGGAVWWTRHTRDGVQLVLELPEALGGLALELLLLEVRGGRTRWAWRTERGGGVEGGGGELIGAAPGPAWRRAARGVEKERQLR